MKALILETHQAGWKITSKNDNEMDRKINKLVLFFMFLKGLTVHAQGLTGVNTVNPSSTLHINGSIAGAIKVVSASYTLTAGDYTLIISAVTPPNSITVTFPAAASCPGRIYVIVNRTSASANSPNIESQSFSSYNGSAAELNYMTGTTAPVAVVTPTGTTSSGTSANIQVNNMRTMWQSDGTYWWLIATG